MNGKVKESHFSTELRKSCEAQGIFYYKIPDAFGMQRFSPKKPFDAIIIYRGKTICIENKLDKSVNSFNFNKIKGHQYEGLQKAKDSGAECFFFINHRNKKTNKIYITDVKRIQELSKDLPSIQYGWLADYCWAVLEKIKNPNGKGRIWDIKRFCSIIFRESNNENS